MPALSVLFAVAGIWKGASQAAAAVSADGTRLPDCNVSERPAYALAEQRASSSKRALGHIANLTTVNIYALLYYYYIKGQGRS